MECLLCVRRCQAKESACGKTLAALESLEAARAALGAASRTGLAARWRCEGVVRG